MQGGVAAFRQINNGNGSGCMASKNLHQLSLGIVGKFNSAPNPSTESSIPRQSGMTINSVSHRDRREVADCQDFGLLLLRAAVNPCGDRNSYAKAFAVVKRGSQESLGEH